MANACLHRSTGTIRPTAGRLTGHLATWILIGLTISGMTARAQDAPIELIHADQVSLERSATGNAYHARGNVHFRQGRSELWAQEAIWYENTGEIYLYREVKVEDTAETLLADTVRYIAQSDRAFARGHVRYRRPEQDLMALADRGEYDRTSRTAKLFENARMIFSEADSSGRIETWADTLWFFAEADSGVARGHVQVFRPDGKATAEEAVFTTFPDGDRVVFTGQPEGTFQDNDVSGDTLTLAVRDGEIHRLIARGQTRAVFRERSSESGRTTESDLTADQMHLFFQGGTLRELVAVGQARSRYVPAWGRPGERNDASGDTVKISIADSTVRRVQVIAGAEGTYHSPQQAASDSTALSVDTIYYESSYIDYRVDRAAIRLWDHVELTYGPVTLNAGQVLYTTDSSVLRAYALDDSLLPPPVDYRGPATDPSAVAERSDSTDRPGEASPDSSGAIPEPRVDTPSSRPVTRDPQQRPVLRDGTQEVRGRRLVYDIDTQRGRIIDSYTAEEKGYYRGSDFRKESAKTFYVEHGRFTTCNLDHPHFEFTGDRMKIRDRDRVMARPVLLTIEGLPVLWVPYYVFSIKPERHSGLLPVRFGNFQRGSRFVRNIGYYFAASDYFDFAPAVDVVEGEGLLWHLRAAYAVRYLLSGSVYASYNRHTRLTRTGEQRTTRWNLQFRHNQQLSSTATLAGSGNFVSDNSYYQDFTANPNERLNRRLRSQLNLNKRWGSTSLTLALDDSRNLDDDSRTSYLPRLTLSLPTRQIFAPRTLKGGVKQPARWYLNFRWGYNSSGQNVTRAYRAFRPIDSALMVDSTKKLDTVQVQEAYTTLDHRLSFSYSQKFLNAISFTPSLNVQETWYYVFAPSDTVLPSGVQDNRFYRRMAGAAGASAQTNLYGIFPVNRGRLVGFRHVFTPSVRYSLSPAITQNEEVRRYTGLGGGGSVLSQSIGVGINNLFQMKTTDGETEKQWELLNVTSAASYNLEATTRKWSNISTSLRSGLLRNPDISVSMIHDPYDPVSGEFDWTPRLVNISTSLSLRLAGGGTTVSGNEYAQGGTYQAEGGGLQSGFGGGSAAPLAARSWNLTGSYRFSESRNTTVTAGQANTTRSITHWIQSSVRYAPTSNWDVQMGLYYDLKRKEMTDWTIRLHRLLHCWEADFSWVITGARAGYYFRINAIDLPDLKFEKSESGIQDALFGTLANP